MEVSSSAAPTKSQSKQIQPQITEMFLLRRPQGTKNKTNSRGPAPKTAFLQILSCLVGICPWVTSPSLWEENYQEEKVYQTLFLVLSNGSNLPTPPCTHQLKLTQELKKLKANSQSRNLQLSVASVPQKHEQFSVGPEALPIPTYYSCSFFLYFCCSPLQTTLR